MDTINWVLFLYKDIWYQCNSKFLQGFIFQCLKRILMPKKVVFTVKDSFDTHCILKEFGFVEFTLTIYWDLIFDC